MEYLSKIIAENFRHLRKSKNMSLDMVAEKTGVSKSMLAQIERGKANPTIGTLGRIAGGLQIKMDDLMAAAKNKSCLVAGKNLVSIREVPGHYAVYLCFPYEKERNFAVYEVVIEAGQRYRSGSHGEKTTEYISVIRGRLTVRCGEEVSDILPGDLFCFASDKEHEYRGFGSEKTEFVVFLTH